MSDIAYADKNCLIATIHTPYSGDLPAKRTDILSVSLLTKLSETTEILSDLRWGKAQLLSKLKRRNTADPIRLQIIQLPQISRQAPNHIIGNLNTFLSLIHSSVVNNQKQIK